MVLWNHLNTLICKVFPSSLSDLGLKWFEKLPLGSIGIFLQLFKSFVTRFVINAKALKGVSSFLTLQNGKNETLHNHSKRYEIKRCSEELAVVSYKLRLTLSE